MCDSQFLFGSLSEMKVLSVFELRDVNISLCVSARGASLWLWRVDMNPTSLRWETHRGCDNCWKLGSWDRPRHGAEAMHCRVWQLSARMHSLTFRSEVVDFRDFLENMLWHCAHLSGIACFSIFFEICAEDYLNL